MQKYVLCFVQKSLMKLNIKADELIILHWFKNFYESGNMRMKEFEGEKYGWVNLAKVKEDLPMLGLTERRLSDRLHNLVDKGVLSYKVGVKMKLLGTETFYNFNPIAYKFLIGELGKLPTDYLDYSKGKRDTKTKLPKIDTGCAIVSNCTTSENGSSTTSENGICTTSENGICTTSDFGSCNNETNYSKIKELSKLDTNKLYSLVLASKEQGLCKCSVDEPYIYENFKLYLDENDVLFMFGEDYPIDQTGCVVYNRFINNVTEHLECMPTCSYLVESETDVCGMLSPNPDDDEPDTEDYETEPTAKGKSKVSEKRSKNRKTATQTNENKSNDNLHFVDLVQNMGLELKSYKENTDRTLETLSNAIQTVSNGSSNGINESVLTKLFSKFESAFESLDIRLKSIESGKGEPTKAKTKAKKDKPCPLHNPTFEYINEWLVKNGYEPISMAIPRNHSDLKQFINFLSDRIRLREAERVWKMQGNTTPMPSDFVKSIPNDFPPVEAFLKAVGSILDFMKATAFWANKITLSSLANSFETIRSQMSAAKSKGGEMVGDAYTKYRMGYTCNDTGVTYNAPISEVLAQIKKWADNGVTPENSVFFICYEMENKIRPVVNEYATKILKEYPQWDKRKHYEKFANA